MKNEKTRTGYFTDHTLSKEELKEKLQDIEVVTGWGTIKYDKEIFKTLILFLCTLE